MVKKTAQNFFSERGFTLIEILVTISILSILAVLTIASYVVLQRQVDIDSSTQKILSTLRLARTQTLSSENESSYGVHFESDKFVLFKGTIYDSSAVTNKEFLLNGAEIYEINLNGGGSDIVFNRIRGTTNQQGNIKVRLTSETSRTNIININSSGQVSLNDTLSTTGTRAVDSRHLHFDLGWSIQNANTLTLAFTDSPNPPVTQNISMTGFFNVGKTAFDWSGKIGVNGTEQEIRVHTHSIDAFNTILSVHRDRRFNDKALTISIDSKQIVSFTAGGSASVGAFGGTMTTQ